ncbi:TraR/DksA family transcriptional regulator [Nocardioides jensenii]|uniref:TraR/DksA family transcriptional regulator n=1 Tax=Nocardioides jensenii TaxID=1843 RepID=UPI0008338FD7|nr:TraR/DksA C4-type zinc finger protein [Nocardioides jensenii]
MADIRAALERERRATHDRLAALTADFEEVVAASRDTNADDEHDPEGSTIAFERSQLDALVRQARAHLGEIDAALTRLAAGTYGRCEQCGRHVPDGRLAVRPTARTCVDCAS